MANTDTIHAVAETEGRRPHVVFVINAPIVGGAEKHTFAVTEGLARRGWRTAVFAVRHGNLAAPAAVEFCQPAVGAQHSFIGRLLNLAAFIRAQRPDVVIGVNGRPLLMAYLARVLARRPCALVGITHSSIFRTRYEALWEMIYRPFYSRAQSLVFISQNQRRLWREYGIRPRTDTVILNGIDMDRFSLASRNENRATMRRKLGFSQADFVVGCCSMLRPEKNHLQLVEAIARLRRRNIPAKALIVGDGPMRQAILAAAVRTGVSDQVQLIGAQTDVRPYLSTFDIGVLCSKAIETLSLAALETMATGVPMLMSDLGGASEIVDGANGAIFPVGDTDALEALLCEFYARIQDADLGQGIRDSVVTKFDQNTMIDGFAEYLKRYIYSPGLNT